MAKNLGPDGKKGNTGAGDGKKGKKGDKGKGKNDPPNVNGPHPTKNRGKNPNFLGQGALGKVPPAMRPDSFKTIRKESRKAIRPTFKPALHDIKVEKKSTKSMDAKRAADNQFYLNWLDTQNQQMQAHDQAAQATVDAQNAAMRQQSIQAMKDMHGQLVQAAGNHTGTVSNANDAQAFDMTAESTRDLQKIDAANALSAALSPRGQNANSAARSSNFSQITASEAIRQADTAKRLKELGDAKVKVRLEQASAEAQEIARRLTQEIDKASGVIDFRNKAASQWLANKAQRLERKKFRFDSKFQMAQLSEQQRHNMATEAIDMKNATSGGGPGNENAQNRRDDKKEIRTTLNNAIDGITTHPQIRKAAKENPEKAARMLTDAGFTPTYARAAVYSWLNNGLNNKWKKRLGLK